MHRDLIRIAIDRVRNKNLFVKDYVTGLGITVVELSDGSCGLTHTFREEIFGGCSPFPKLLNTDIRVEEFIQLYDSTDILLSSIGLATINAVLNNGVKFDKTGDIIESLEIQEGDNVALVGDIVPLASSIKKFKPKRLYIFERRAETGKLPDWAIYQLMDKIDVLLLSSSTLINKTFFNLVKSAKTSKIALIGPSTTFCPEVLKEVKVFGGAKVLNAEKLLKIAARAGGTKNIYADEAAVKVQLLPTLH